MSVRHTGVTDGPGHPVVGGTAATVPSACGTVTAGASDVHLARACELRDLLDRLADKWSLLVVELLGDGTRRFTELLRHIDGISQRMLTRTLRNLERDGMVTRTVHPVVPPRVDYRLTGLGRTLLAVTEPLVGWTREHRDAIAEARASFDAAATSA
jgi:DNA-binding HxlR family transcriptional regulator